MAARSYDETIGPLAGIPQVPRWMLVTAHRRELRRALRAHLRGHPPDRADVWRGAARHRPVHPNPHVTGPVSRIMGLPNCSVVPALDYRDLVHVLQRAALT
jgi:hypothetical protein